MPKKHSTKPVRSVATRQAGRLPSAQRATGRNSRTWMQRLEELAAYKKEHGHCCVSTLDETYASLGNWVRTQRSLRRKGQLREQRIRTLDELGFVWDMRKECVRGQRTKWAASYEALAAYQRANGHCRVPSSDQDYARLANWAVSQRRARRKRRLSAERVRKLDALGFPWDVASKEARWEAKFAALAAYRREHGNCFVPVATGDHARLAQWILTQRRARYQGKLSAERARRLDELGFSWEVSGMESKWETQYEALVAYRRTHGDCLVPLTGDHARLARWAETQRRGRRKAALSAERIRRLDELGFVWDVQRQREQTEQAAWESMYEALSAYQRAHGRGGIPYSKDGIPLWQWAVSQRVARRAGRLSAERIRRLNRLGFIWDRQHEQWKKMFAALARYRRPTATATCPGPGPPILNWPPGCTSKECAIKRGRFARAGGSAWRHWGFGLARGDCGHEQGEVPAEVRAQIGAVARRRTVGCCRTAHFSKAMDLMRIHSF